jgi:hypothetical protein
MAPPPKYLITRKLVGKFFQNYLPREPFYAQDEKSKLFECWQINGIDSSKCKELEARYDFMIEQSKQYRQKLDKMGFRQSVMETLTKPKFKHELKGRHAKNVMPTQSTIYDGVF